MPFPHIWYAVKASQKSSRDDHLDDKEDPSPSRDDITAHTQSHDLSPPLSVVVSASSSSSSSLSSSNASASFSPLELLKSRYPDVVQNFEETAEFFTAKIKRIFSKNFGSTEETDESMSETTIPLIENPEKPNYDRQLEDRIFQSIHAEARRREAEATTKDRLRAVLKSQPNGDFSPEMQQLRDVLIYTLGAGLFIGYFRGRKEARKKFIKLNLATKYTSPAAANRKLNDFVISAAFRNGMSTAVPLVGFMAVFTGVSICLSVVENEEKLWHLAAGAAFAGANNRTMLGPRAFLVGGLVGGFLGMGFGSIVISLKRISGIATLREKRYHRHVQEVMEDMYEEQLLPAPPRQFALYNDIPE